MRTPRDPYSVLGVESDVTYEEAKAAYRRLAEIFHPDRFADARDDVQAEAERQMKDLNAAWRTLRIRFGHEDDVAPDNRRDRWRPPSTRDADRQWAAGDDFSTRARQARTRVRAQERRTSTSGSRAEAEERARREAAERDAFVREARERLLREEAEAAQRTDQT
jgi:curved DNA-binding protein CbpA